MSNRFSYEPHTAVVDPEWGYDVCDSFDADRDLERLTKKRIIRPTARKKSSVIAFPIAVAETP